MESRTVTAFNSNIILGLVGNSGYLLVASMKSRASGREACISSKSYL